MIYLDPNDEQLLNIHQAAVEEKNGFKNNNSLKQAENNDILEGLNQRSMTEEERRYRTYNSTIKSDLQLVLNKIDS